MYKEAKKPKVFANKVIKEMVKHMVSDDTVVGFRDYSAIRSVFRRCAGSWEKIVNGDQVHIELLKEIVTGWGQMPERKKKSDQLV